MAPADTTAVDRLSGAHLEEVRELFLSRSALADLFLSLGSGQEDLYERIVGDMGRVAVAYRRWWEETARARGWPSIPGGSWVLSLVTGEVYLCPDTPGADLPQVPHACRWPCGRAPSAVEAPAQTGGQPIAAARGAAFAAGHTRDSAPPAAPEPVPPGPPVADDDTTIVPGERIGPHALWPSPEQLLERLGRPSRAFCGPETLPTDRVPHSGVLAYGSLGVTFVVHGGRITEVSTVNARFRLPGGVGVGAPRDRVIAALGPPDVPSEGQHKEILAYSSGLHLEVAPSSAKVARVAVVPPGRLPGS